MIKIPLLRTPPKSDGNVPCRAINCNRCCYLKTIVLHPELGDDLRSIGAEYDLQLAAWLMPRKDGHCAHLIDGYCSIYDRRPSTCREFDCRVMHGTFTKAQAKFLTSTDAVYQKVFAAAGKLQANRETRLDGAEHVHSDSSSTGSPGRRPKLGGQA